MKPFDLSFNAAVTSIARKVWPLGYDISNNEDVANATDAEAYFADITARRRVTTHSVAKPGAQRRYGMDGVPISPPVTP